MILKEIGSGIIMNMRFKMIIKQFVMAYSAEQDRIRAILPSGFESLRPVLRINAEIREDEGCYIEFNTAVMKDGKKGWLNIWHSDKASVCVHEDVTEFTSPELAISFRRTGITGSCPAERDNDGTFFLYPESTFRKAETITERKEFTDSEFIWNMHDGASGKSQGRTIPAISTAKMIEYEKKDLSLHNAAEIPCIEVLGSYAV